MKLKKYYAFGEDKPPVIYRPGTSDDAIINSILINQQEYRFPSFDDVKLCFDMGGNIGVVAVILANIYPKAIIHSFEPEDENFSILQQNADHYPNITCHNYGLGAATGKKPLYPSADPANLGGFSNFIQHGEPKAVQIFAIKAVVEKFGIPEIIKIDVEGAECEILRNFPNLKDVRYLTGELHGEDAEYLCLHSLSTYFDLAHSREFGEKTWHFHALNKGWTQSRRESEAAPK